MSASKKTVTQTEHDTVSCSYKNLAADIENQVPNLDAIAELSADEIHQNLCDSLRGAAVNYLTAKNLVADAKRRMQEGETVGGCKTWTSYVDTYLRKPNESLPTVIRRLYRLLDGSAVDKKHDGSRNRKNARRAEQAVLEGAADLSPAIPLADELAKAVMELDIPKLPRRLIDLAKRYLQARGTK
jgi:hypothetical protein